MEIPVNYDNVLFNIAADDEEGVITYLYFCV